MRIITALYLVTVHLCLLILFLKTDALPRFEQQVGLPLKHPFGDGYEELLIYQERRAAQIEGQVVFIGDSITAGQNTAAICANSENFGIPGDTLAGLIYRLSRLRLAH